MIVHRLGHSCPFVLKSIPARVHSWPVKYLHLNFSEVFVDRLKAYARKHNMKVNAVLKQAFELLEDRDSRKPQEAPSDFDY
jgi:hypothetical protein